MGRTVCWILGTAYSGSSLLNLLLDGQLGIRGLGEAINLRRDRPDVWCSRCRASMAACPLQKHVDPQAFYSSIFDFYGDCSILVDSSKWWRLCNGTQLPEAGIEYRALLLSKAPHEFAYSWTMHGAADCALAGFRAWISTYTSTLQTAIRPETESLAIAPARTCAVTYRELTLATRPTLQRACDFLGVDFSADRFARWWESDSHLFGGNNAVYAQVTGDRPFLDNPDYLEGKYRGQAQQIFYDRQWKGNWRFVEQCLQAYCELADELDPLLADLGHGSSQDLRGELE